MMLKKMGLEIMTYILVLGGFLCAAILGSRAVTVVSQMVPVEREHIIVIDPGHSAEQGTHAELMAKGGIYAHLIEMQSLA